MVPVIIGGGVFGAAKFLSDVWTADKYEREARNANYEAFTMVAKASFSIRKAGNNPDEVG